MAGLAWEIIISYFYINANFLNVLHLATPNVIAIANDTARVIGFAHDNIADKIYWCSNRMIYRSNRDTTGLVKVLGNPRKIAETGMRGSSYGQGITFVALVPL